MNDREKKEAAERKERGQNYDAMLKAKKKNM
jgi:hypothetical protein